MTYLLRCVVFRSDFEAWWPEAATPAKLEQATQRRRKVSSVMLKLDVVFHVDTFNAVKFDVVGSQLYIAHDVYDDDSISVLERSSSVI